MTVTIQSWHILLVVTVLAAWFAASIRRQSDWDFTQPIVVGSMSLALVAMWFGFLVHGCGK